MLLRTKGATQQVACAKSGISERSGRAIEKGSHRVFRTHHWRTRPDPLSTVWEQELVPLLKQTPSLSPITLLEYLQQRYPLVYPDSVHRTLQRRVKHWRATEGAEREVMFRQIHQPGQQGISDFTRLKQVVITLQGKPYEHLLYHFRLSFSGWSHVKVIEGGESYAALAEGLQEALWRLGGVPAEHRTDSLSAAFKNLSAQAQADITLRYQALCEHYGMRATRNNRGKGHENGSIESPHGHIKRRVRQALLLRGSSDFESVQAYQFFIDEVVNLHNQRHAKQVISEKAYLQALPTRRTLDFTETVARVNSSSTITIGRCTYSVPSRLIGECLRIHLYHDRLEGYVGATQVITFPRLRAQGKVRCRRIDYRHVIHSLARKPQAFRFSLIRDELLPTSTYQAIWEQVQTRLENKAACQFIVGLLLIATQQDCETVLGETVLKALQQGNLPTLEQLRRQFMHATVAMPTVVVNQYSLQAYDTLLTFSQENTHGAC